MDHPTADRSSPPAVAPSERGLPLGRFSPLTAPERDVVDQFCADTRPWALREAKRSYRHLPAHLREQAVDRALQELRSSAPASVDRRRLMSDLAGLLTAALRHLHVGWCLNASTVRLRREGLETRDGYGVARDGLAEFVEHGLGGFERAVLQLEIGAGRDSRTTRAALRLGPREYSRHRESGLSKLRDAIGARVQGRVCDQHLSSVVLAATGDRRAATVLQGGSSRCRACAREAQGLRTVLNERLAVAPWPLAIQPAGALAAKLGAVTAVFGGKSAGGVAVLSGSGGAGAGAAATVVAAAALATGATAVVDGDRHEQRIKPAAPNVTMVTPKAIGRRLGSQAAPSVARAASRPNRAKAKVKAERTGTLQVSRPAKRRDGKHAPPAAAVTAAPQTVAAAPLVADREVEERPTLGVTVDETIGEVNDTVKGVTEKLPSGVQQPLDQTLDGVGQTVDELTNTLDGLLKP